MHPCIHASMHPCMHTYIHIYIYIYIYIYISYIHMYVYIEICRCHGSNPAHPENANSHVVCKVAKAKHA